MRDLNNKATGDTLSADEWNDVPSEIQNAIESSGQSLTGSNLSQLVRAISKYSVVGDYYVGTGSANVYVANVVSPAVSPPSLVAGLRLRVLIPFTNTGGITLNAFGTGVIGVRLSGGSLNAAAGDVVAGLESEFTFRSTHWELINPRVSGVLRNHYYLGGGVVNAYTATVISPEIAPPSLTNGMQIRMIVPITNTGGITLNAFGFGMSGVRLEGGVANVGPDDVVAGLESTFTFRTSPTSHWELTNPRSSGITPVGSVIMSAVNSVPTGWLKCNGNLVSRITFSALFDQIGTIYGTGNGTTTFNLPDYRGYFLRGLDDGRGVDISRTFGSAQAAEFQSHQHQQTVIGSTEVINIVDSPSAEAISGNSPQPSNQDTQSAGGVETRPVNYSIVYLIKAF